MWASGDPILNYAANQDAWFYASTFENDKDSAVGVFRNTTTNLGNTLACPAGTHNLAASIACWPLGPSSAGYGAVIVNELPTGEGGYSIDSPASLVDSRTSGTGAGDVYITDTTFSEYSNTSSINLMACNNALTACSYPEMINATNSSAQFSDVKTMANGNITITYGNYSTQRSPSQYAYIYEVDIYYVVCTPQGAPNPPSCSAPVLVASEWQPVNMLASLSDVRNNTRPVHVETPKGTYVFWERCGSYSDLPFGGVLTYGGVACPDADIVGAYSSSVSPSWTLFNVDNAYGHQIMPWATYDSSYDKIAIVYQDCDTGGKTACRAGYRTISPSGSTTVSGFSAVSSYAYPEADANRPYFEPLFGDYIGAAAYTSGGRSTLWIGFSDTSRVGTYGFGTESVQDSNNNVAAVDSY
jgi:hypothetical protein